MVSKIYCRWLALTATIIRPLLLLIRTKSYTVPVAIDSIKIRANLRTVHSILEELKSTETQGYKQTWSMQVLVTKTT